MDAEWKNNIVERGLNLEVRRDMADVDQVMVAEVGPELDIAQLLDRRSKLADEQHTIKFKIREELEKLEAYTTYATRKQHDYSPFIRKMLGYLADKQSLQQYI